MTIPEIMRKERIGYIEAKRRVEAGEQRAVDSSALLAAEKEPDWEALKLALNNAVWMHAPTTTTLAQAEEATCQAISYLAKCRNAANH